MYVEETKPGKVKKQVEFRGRSVRHQKEKRSIRIRIGKGLMSEMEGCGVIRDTGGL
jgi:hypothetical protein